MIEANMTEKAVDYNTNEYNKDELVAPKWLTKEYLEQVLKKHHNDTTIQITSYDVTPASKKGDHFASIMFRIKISYKTNDCSDEEISVVLKTLPEEDCLKNEMLQDTFIFQTEISMYENIIPKYEAILKENGDDTKLGAQLLYSTVEPRKVIIFEDLAVKGFTSIGLRTATLEESKLGLIKLAKWHAVSFKLKFDGDDSVTRYQEGAFNMPNIENRGLFCDGIVQFINLLKNDTELQQYLPKFENLQKKNILKQCTAIYNLGRGFRDHQSTGIYVLNHGDFHAKNLMFKMDSSGISKDVMMVDFQLCLWGPAVIDVIYFIYMMLSPEVRLTKRDELIHFYFTTFIDTLKTIKYSGPLPKLVDLHIDMIKYRYLELMLIMSILPLFHGITSEDLMSNIEISDIMETADLKSSFYRNPKYVNEVKGLLKQFYYKGYLD